MRTIFFLLLFHSFTTLASVVGISTHPMNDDARVLSAEMTGYMSQRHEMGMGLRYTDEVGTNKLLDVSASGGQDSRALIAGMGLDMAILEEDVSQPRFSLKPFLQYQKYEDMKSNLIGMAPTLRKGFSINGQEFFPYLALPTGVKINDSNSSMNYYSSLTLGASMPFPGSGTDKLLLSLEGNKNMGQASDYIGCLVSWVWR